jgi:hypothetical protein
MTIAAFNSSDYKLAAARLRQSEWFNQVGQRSRDIVETLEELP